MWQRSKQTYKRKRNGERRHASSRMAEQYLKQGESHVTGRPATEVVRTAVCSKLAPDGLIDAALCKCVIWGARCGESARRVLLGETRSSDHTHSVRRERDSAFWREAPHGLSSSGLVSTILFDLWADVWRRPPPCKRTKSQGKTITSSANPVGFFVIFDERTAVFQGGLEGLYINRRSRRAVGADRI